MIHSLDCMEARELLSTRLDGELADANGERALGAHLVGCEECRAHERALADLTRGFDALRAPEPPLADLWPRIERRLRRLAAPPVPLRAAAALVGFLGLGAAALALESRGAAAPDHRLFERLAPDASERGRILEALPEYRLLRALPTEDDR